MREQAPSRHGAKRIASLLGAIALVACGAPKPDVVVTDATYRAPLGGAEIGVGYFTIQSRRTDRILSIESPIARAVEMHETVLTGTSSSMQQRRAVDLPANKPVSFAPGGLHLMIFEPQALEKDATFPITLRLESGEAIDVKLAAWEGLSGGS